MKRIIYFVCLASLIAVGCQKFDPSDLWSNIDSLDKRVTALEELCKKMNTNIEALQTLVNAEANKDYITNVSPVQSQGKVIGYTITFAKAEPITIYHGKDGADGQDGADGKDGQTPVIGVRKDVDEVYYWTLNGEWLLDESGQKIKTEGKDGADGQDGKPGQNGQDGQDGADGKPGQDGADGKDGITPQLKIEDGKWYVSYNNGSSWVEVGPATGPQGPQGPQGPAGVGGDSMFSDFDYTSSSDYVIFTLSNGTQIKIPTWTAFESLKEKCDQMNKNIEALQTIVKALEDKDYVTSVTPIYQEMKEIGYVINFSKSGKVTIYHGKDGADGQDGADGKDGQIPVIGVRKDVDEVYYWTLNGEWLLDESGQKIKAEGKDGADGQDGKPGQDGQDGQDGADGKPGQDGADGKDGITPQLKIEDGKWYVSYNNGSSWVEVGPATGPQGPQGPQGPAGVGGDSMFKSVTYDESNVYLTLKDGTKLTVPRTPESPVTLTLGKVTGFTATFNGTVIRKSYDLKVTVYYSTTNDLTVYKNSGHASQTEFPGNTFELKLKKLGANTTYYYFYEIIYKGQKSFSETGTFRTGDPDSLEGWGDGDQIGGGI